MPKSVKIIWLFLFNYLRWCYIVVTHYLYSIFREPDSDWTSDTILKLLDVQKFLKNLFQNSVKTVPTQYTFYKYDQDRFTKFKYSHTN